MPILSVDVQPNGFRFVTGGSDNKVCVWNLLPVISEKHERMGRTQKNAQNSIPRRNSNGNEEVKVNANGDVEMRDNDATHEKSKDSESDLIDVSANSYLLRYKYIYFIV